MRNMPHQLWFGLLWCLLSVIRCASDRWHRDLHLNSLIWTHFWLLMSLVVMCRRGSARFSHGQTLTITSPSQALTHLQTVGWNIFSFKRERLVSGEGWLPTMLIFFFFFLSCSFLWLKKNMRLLFFYIKVSLALCWQVRGIHNCYCLSCLMTSWTMCDHGVFYIYKLNQEDVSDLLDR